MIKKSFLVCGQLKDGNPDEITCMKEGKPAHGALEEVKKIWNLDASEFGSSTYQNPEEIDDDEDPTVLDVDDDNDE